jgi:hypothetical protein
MPALLRAVTKTYTVQHNDGPLGKSITHSIEKRGKRTSSSQISQKYFFRTTIIRCFWTVRFYLLHRVQYLRIIYIYIYTISIYVYTYICVVFYRISYTRTRRLDKIVYSCILYNIIRTRFQRKRVVTYILLPRAIKKIIYLNRIILLYIILYTIICIRVHYTFIRV